MSHRAIIRAQLASFLPKRSYTPRPGWPLFLSPPPQSRPHTSCRTNSTCPSRQDTGAQIKRSWLVINGASLYLHQEYVRSVCVCMQSGVVNHAECAPVLPLLPCPYVPFGVQPLRAIDRIEITQLFTHTYTQARHPTTDQPPADRGKKKSWKLHQHIILMDL